MKSSYNYWNPIMERNLMSAPAPALSTVPQIARECLASSSVMQLASAIEIVSRKLKSQPKGAE